MQPLFKTSNSPDRKRPVKNGKPKRNARDILIQPTTGASRMLGLSDWAGSSHALVERSRAAKQMLSRGYWESLNGSKRATDTEIKVLIRDVLRVKHTTFTKTCEYEAEERTLVVYSSDQSDRVITVDKRLAPPDKVVAAKSLDGPPQIIDADRMESVKYIAAVYTLNDTSPLDKKLGR